MAKIICNCKHEYQEKKYGSNIRIGVPKKTTQGAQEFVCTVCLTKTTKEVK